MNTKDDTSFIPPQQPRRWRERMSALEQRWAALGDNERGALSVLAWVLGIALIWVLAVQPAKQVLRDAPARLEAVDRQLQEMQTLAVEAGTLRAVPTVPAAQALEALTAASTHLGAAARLTVSGDRAVLHLSGAGLGSDALGNWLGEVRSAARARPVEVQLQRGPQGYTGSITLVLTGAGT